MKNILGALFVFAVLTQTALAGTSTGQHSDHDQITGHSTSAIGSPGLDAEVTRTIDVEINETGEVYMLFDPDVIHIEHDTTVRFKISNLGALDHEFFLGTFDEVEQHRHLKKRTPQMEHNDHNAVNINPGETAEVLWKFSRIMNLEYACLIPGHRELGMWGVIIVHDHIAPKSKG